MVRGEGDMVRGRGTCEGYMVSMVRGGDMVRRGRGAW